MSETQIQENTTNIVWLKKSFERMEESMKRQTAILFTILISIVTIFITALTQGLFNG